MGSHATYGLKNQCDVCEAVKMNQWAVPVHEIAPSETRTTYPKPIFVDFFLQPTALGYASIVVPTGKKWRIMSASYGHTLGAVDFFSCVNAKFFSGGFVGGGISFFNEQIVDLLLPTHFRNMGPTC